MKGSLCLSVVISVLLVLFASSVASAADGNLIVNGKLGIGTTSPYEQVEIAASTRGRLLVSDGGGAARKGVIIQSPGSSVTYGRLIPWDWGTGSGMKLIINETGAYVGIGSTTLPSYPLHISGNAYSTGSFISASDARWKKNIQPINGANAIIQKLQGVTYDWRTEEFSDRKFEDGRQIGLIAQEVEKVLPEIVKTDSEGYKAVAYEKLTVVLVEAVKEQQKRIDKLEAELTDLKRK